MSAIILDFKTGRLVRSVRRAKAPTPATLQRQERLAAALVELRTACCTLIGEGGALAFYDLAPADHKQRAKLAYRGAMRAIAVANETLVYLRRGPWVRRPKEKEGRARRQPTPST
jgi:hypothetical protein